MSSLSLPCLNKKEEETDCSIRYNHEKKKKTFGMVSEPLLPLENFDVQGTKTKDSRHYESVMASAGDDATCEGPHLVTETGARSGSLEYCYFCSQSGPVIKEKSHDDQKSKRKSKSQSALVLIPFGSNGMKWPQLHAYSHGNLTGARSMSASVLNGAALKVQQSSRNIPKDQSISSSLSKGTEVHESCGLMCRICHGGSEEEELIRPCRCTGTVKHAHQSCILNWVSKSGNQSCELCKFKFRTRKESVKCLWKWRFPEVSTKGWLHIGLFIAFATMLLTSITWIIWSRVSRTPSAVAERTTEEVKFAYMVNGLFIALAVGGLYFDSLKHFKQYSKRWAALNRNVVVECYTSEDSGKVKGLGVTSLQSVRSPDPRVSLVSNAIEESEASHGSTSRHEPSDWV